MAIIVTLLLIVEHQNILKLEIPTSYFTSFPKVMHFYMLAPTLQKNKNKHDTTIENYAFKNTGVSGRGPRL